MLEEAFYHLTIHVFIFCLNCDISIGFRSCITIIKELCENERRLNVFSFPPIENSGVDRFTDLLHDFT